MCLGESPAVWKNVTTGNHAITVMAHCNNSTVTQRKEFTCQIN